VFQSIGARAPQQQKDIIMTKIKIQRAQRLAGITGMPVTTEAVIAALNTEALALADCSSKQIGAVLRLIQTQYHAGRKSAGAEVIDGDAIWIEARQQLVGFEQLPSAA
jgi:hypothetical protein